MLYSHAAASRGIKADQLDNLLQKKEVVGGSMIFAPGELPECASPSCDTHALYHMNRLRASTKTTRIMLVC